MHLSGFGTLQQRSAKSKFIGLSPCFFFFFFRLVGGGGVVTTFTSNAVVFQQEEAADLTRRSGNDAIMEMNASKVSN